LIKFSQIINLKKLILSLVAVISAVAIILTAVTSSRKNNSPAGINTASENIYELENLPELSAKHCIVTEYESGRILYEKNAYRKSAMASTTKIMTAMIVIAECDLEETVTVSQNAASIGGSEIKLKTGEKISVNDLLYGLMLESGNDAATALAEHTAGTVEDFCILMNNKAKEIGADNTNFTSPHGLDDDEHYTTAYDLSLITKEALGNETFRQIVSTKTYTAGKRHFVNTNALLGTVDGVDGGKTGFTNNAGRCIVLTVKRGGMRIIIVIFGCPDNLNRTIDGKRIIECIYKNYKIYDLIPDSLKIGTLDIKKSKTKPSDIVTSGGIKIPLTEKEYSGLSCTAEIAGNRQDVDIELLKKSQFNLYTDKNSRSGNICGKITINSGEKFLCSVDVVHTSDIQSKKYYDYLVLVLKEYAFLFRNK